MSNEIMIAIFSLVGTLAGSLGGVLTANKLCNYRIEQLENRVKEHNNLIKRTYELEKKTDIIDEQMHVVNHRIADLEGIK